MQRLSIKELTARVTNKAIERAALTKSWVLEKLRENAEKALQAPHGPAWRTERSSWETGTEVGMFRNDGPVKHLSLDDLSTEDLEKLMVD